MHWPVRLALSLHLARSRLRSFHSLGVGKDKKRMLVSESVEEVHLYCTGIPCGRVVRDEAFFLIQIFGSIKGQVVEEISNEVAPPSLVVTVTMDAFQSIVGNLLSLGDWVESNAIIVTLCIAISLEEEIKLLDCCSSLLLLSHLLSLRSRKEGRPRSSSSARVIAERLKLLASIV